VDIKKYWETEAQNIPWFKKWTSILEWDEPFARWFVDGQLNASYAALDVHVNSNNRNKVAIYWEDEDGNTTTISYLQLYNEVNRLASAFKKMGINKGDRIIIYLPMIPQAVVAMLAAARVGATHSVLFSAFGCGALSDRINDCKAKVIVTADFGRRRGKLIPLKSLVDQAIKNCPSIEHVIVVKRTKETIEFYEKRDLLYDEILKNADDYIAPEPVESSHPLFILYTSGTTGKPKGIVHSTGGYLVYASSVFKKAFAPQDDSTYWCTADIGWITGHSFVVYAPLVTGTTVVMYEGGPDYPAIDRWWSIIEKYKVSIFYTAPTVLRMLMRHGTEPIKKHNLSSLKVLGTVGEVINPEVWEWFFQNIGGNRCRVIDTWWQTETGGFMISPRADSKIKLKPGSATFPLPGVEAAVVDEYGRSVPFNTKGFLVIKKPWPGMLMGIYNDPERYKNIYWSRFKGMYYSGDFASIDKDGYFWLLGRSDEALKVAGHLLGTAEIESAAIAAFCVTEAAAIGVPDEIKGEAVVLFVTLRNGVLPDNETKREVVESIRHLIGPIATPKEVHFVESLPKTRSGKIMRRVLKAIAMGEDVGDISTLENESSVEEARLVSRP
jgi:acetyl-CoA synthetase